MIYLTLSCPLNSQLQIPITVALRLFAYERLSIVSEVMMDGLHALTSFYVFYWLGSSSTVSAITIQRRLIDVHIALRKEVEEA